MGSRVRNSAQHVVETVTLERAEERQAKNKKGSDEQESLETEALLSALDVGKGFANHWIFFYTGVRDRPFVGFNF